MAFGTRKILQGTLVLNFIITVIAEKFSLKFLLCITNVERLIQTNWFVAFFVRFRVRSASVEQAGSTPAHLK